jgi:hypothetical protein
MALNRRRLLYQSTHSRVASSTPSGPRQGPLRRISSVLNKPMIDSARALMLLQLSSGQLEVLPGLAEGSQVGPDFAGQEALQAADDLGFGLAFGGASREYVCVGL